MYGRLLHACLHRHKGIYDQHRVQEIHVDKCPKTYGCCERIVSHRGVAHLDLGIYVIGTGQRFAIHQLAHSLSHVKDNIYYHNYLNMSEIVGSYNKPIEEKTAEESVLEVLFMASLRDSSTYPHFETHMITKEGLVRRVLCTFIEACIRFEHIATQMLDDKNLVI